MPVYYNENDPFAVRWLKNLIACGHIASGDVDDRSIVDVKASDLAGYSQCHFFAGIGGWSYALRLAGWPDDRPVWTGSCPCQPFSSAGKGKAADDERHLWPAWFPLIAECRPAIVFGEQVEAAIGWGWLDVVLTDLEAEGYACGAAVLPASGIGAPHCRHRLWFVGHTLSKGPPQRECNGRVLHQEMGGHQGQATIRRSNPWHLCQWLPCTDGRSRPIEPSTQPLAHGVSARVGRLRAYGNAIVPQIAAEFIKATM